MDAGRVADASAARTELLLGQAQGESQSRDMGKIEKAGHDFESLLLGTWLQSAEKSFAAAPGGADEGEDQDGSNDQYMSMAMGKVADMMVNAGGIGLSKMIVEHLQAKEGAAKPASPEAQ